jgi:MATE family multidrug resistance protein
MSALDDGAVTAAVSLPSRSGGEGGPREAQPSGGPGGGPPTPASFAPDRDPGLLGRPSPPLRGGREATGRLAPWLDELGATLKLAWPLILGNLAHIGTTTTDLVLIGALGPDAIAASALANNLFYAAFMLGLGVLTAVSPLVAEVAGRGRHVVRESRRTVRQGLWAAVALSLPIWLAMWHGEAILVALGQEPRLARMASGYLFALQWMLLPAFVFLVLRNFLAAMQRPMLAVALSLAALPVNGVLAWALIHGRLGLPALGLEGAGVATSLVVTLQVAVLVWLLGRDRRFRRFHLFGRWWWADWPRFRKVWRVGLPIGLILLFEVGIFNAAAFIMGAIGAPELAAHTIALQIGALCFMIPMGLGQAATVRVGRAYGAGDRAGIARAGWTAFAVAILYACGTALLLVAMPGPLAGLFLDWRDPANAAVLALATGFLAYAALFQLADAGQAAAAGMLRGLQDTRVPMIVAGVGYWLVGGSIAVGLGLYTPLRGAGVWLGLSAGLAFVAVALTWRWARRERLGLTRAAT